MTMMITTRKPTMKNFDLLVELILNGSGEMIEKQATKELKSLLSTANYLRDVDRESYLITEMWKSVKRLFR